MMCLILLVVITVCAGQVLERSPRSVDQPPYLIGLVALDPPGFVVTWEAMRELAGEPIDGYKVHVWELLNDGSHVEAEHYTLEDGRPVNQVIHVTAKFDETLPKCEARVIDVRGADNTKVIYTPAQLNVHYEIRVQAYNREGTGLMSNAMGLILHRERY